MTTATDVVKIFLDAMGQRDFAAMERVMAPTFKMTVTGGAVFTHPREFSAQSRLRQKSAKKTTDRYEEIPSGSSTIVYSIGSMAGEWNNGTPFSGIRYIDRFEVANGKIVDMNVWSDMSEFRPRD
ncbi:MAG: nuclear transport factor 2 family protein [Rhodospirillaceae bacterium]|nr:nuclear transport factor 2 family protein [Rhodospirillaceae bacterium]